MRKRLILIVGPPGIGKSTLAEALALELGCCYLDKDFISGPIRAARQTISKQDSDITYAVLYDMIAGNLKVGRDVIVDAPLVKQIKAGEQPGRFQDVATLCGAELKIIQLKCDPDALKVRLTKRGDPRDAEKLAKWEEFLREEPIDTPITLPSHSITSTDPIQKQLRLARRYVDREEGHRSPLMQVVRKNYKFKKPIERGKNNAESPAIWAAAYLFQVHRLLSGGQFIKLLFRLRMKSVDAPVPVMHAESVAIGSFLLAVLNALLITNHVQIMTFPLWVLITICLWRIFDVLFTNLYYLMMRPIVERNPPHNLFRSFILGAVAVVEVWVIIGLIWHFVWAAGYPVAGDSILHNMYAAIKGDDLAGPSSRDFTWLTLVTMGSLWTMISVVFARAISLLPPLPTAETDPES